MNSYSVAVMREFDRRTVSENRMSGYELMIRAGTAAFRKMEELIQSLPDLTRIVFLAGKGNNGGDVFVMTRLAAESKLRPFELHLTCSPDQLSGDALSAWNDLPDPIKQQTRFTLLPEDLPAGTLVIDGLLGTGISGVPRGIPAEWIHIVNNSKQPVLAVDIPSGLNADTGESAGETIRADVTVTMAGVKNGLLLGAGPAHTGRLEVVRIGIPPEFYAEAPVGIPLFGAEDAFALLKRENADSYKNQRGHLFVIGGSADYPSAPFLSGESALRSGAGLVTVLLPKSTGIFCKVPRALIVRRLPDQGNAFSSVAVPALHSAMEHANALAVGPGLSRACDPLFLKELFQAAKPAVFDADALNLLSENPEFIALRKNETLLTPHPGEMARLMKAWELDSKDRVSDACALAEKTNCVILLKGPHSVVAEPDGKYTLNLSGNAALATAGSGDVLTGICGALLAAGYTAAEAGRLGAFLHGLTGEILSPVGSRGLTADDLAENVSRSFKKILPVW